MQLEGLILCRRVELESNGAIALTGGFFTSVAHSRFPSRIKGPAFLIGHISGVRHTTNVDISLTYLRPDEAEPVPLFRRSQPVRPPADVRQATVLLMDLDGVELPGHGEYRFQVWHGDTELGRKRMFADILHL